MVARSKIGPHTLDIPAGALTEPTVVTAEAPGSNLVTVTFSPHGLTFLKQPELTLSYARCLSAPRLSVSIGVHR